MASQGGKRKAQQPQEGGDKKKRSWHQTNAKAGLPLGAQGFLISYVNGRDRQATQEAEALLKEYYERLVPAGAAPAAKTDASESEQPSKDFSSLIKSEVADMKQSKGKTKLFHYHNTNVNGLLFFMLAKEAGCTPAELLTCMAEDVEKTQQNRCRVCLRFLPIDVVCAADLEEIRNAALKLCGAAFPKDGPALKFAIQYEHRASKQLKRDQVIDAVADAVPKPPHSVNLSDPDRTIIAQLCKGQCALGVVAGYKRFAKFNLLELSQKEAKEAAAAEEAAAKAKAAAAAPETDGQAAPAGTGSAAEAAELPSAADVPVPAPQQQDATAAPGSAAAVPEQTSVVVVQPGVQADAVVAGALQDATES